MLGLYLRPERTGMDYNDVPLWKVNWPSSSRKS